MDRKIKILYREFRVLLLSINFNVSTLIPVQDLEGTLVLMGRFLDVYALSPNDEGTVFQSSHLIRTLNEKNL